MTEPILTVTFNPAIDLELVVPALRRGQVLRAEAVRRSAGGKGVNVSRALAALGVPSAAAILTGGPDGEVFKSLLAGAPFGVHWLEGGGPTRTNVTLETARPGQPAGAYDYKVNQPGAALAPGAAGAIFAALEPLLAGRRWVVFSGSLAPGMPASAYAGLVLAARRHGALAAIDAEGAPLAAAAAVGPELIKINRRELASVAGRALPRERDVPDAMRELQQAGARNVVVTAGGKACFALDAEGTLTRHKPPARPGGPRIGAGDAFLAALLARLMAGDPLAAAIDFAANFAAPAADLHAKAD